MGAGAQRLALWRDKEWLASWALQAESELARREEASPFPQRGQQENNNNNSNKSQALLQFPSMPNISVVDSPSGWLLSMGFV